jgi:putative iron-only hydrogenase system regulator
MENAKRLAVIGIVISDRAGAAAKVNEVLSAHADAIVGRMGVPYPARKVSAIALIADGTTDELGALTGRLGQIPGVKAKVALTG